MWMAGNYSRPPMCQGPRPFPTDLLQARACRSSGSQRDYNQEMVHGTLPLFHRENILSRGGQRPLTQQVGKAQLLPGPKDRNLCEAGTSAYLSLPNSRLCPPSPRLRLSRRYGTPTSHQKPVLYGFLISPPTRRVLTGRHQH